MGGEQSRQTMQNSINAKHEAERQSYEAAKVTLQQLDARTKVPHLLIELRNLGYIEICGKDTGGIYERLDGWLKATFNVQPVTMAMREFANLEMGCCVNPGLTMGPISEWDDVCDKNYACGSQTYVGTVSGKERIYLARGNEGENNMGKLTMIIVNFMTNTCGWGLQLCDGGNLGMYGQIREQQIKFKAPHPLNLIAPHLMIELRQVGYVEVNGPNQDGIYEKIDAWIKHAWKGSRTNADPNFCDLKFTCGSAFKKRGNEGENNMGLRTMEIVDFMVKECAWTLITCNGGNYGRKGDKREQQMVFRNDQHVQHGLNHIMVEFRDIGYIEVNGLVDAADAGAALEQYFKQTWRCNDYKQGMWEKEMYCDKKYSTPQGFYYRQGSTNNLGKRTIELATYLGTKGWILMLCNGGNISDYHGYHIKREQQVKFTKARAGEQSDLPLLMIELRTVPTNLGVGRAGMPDYRGLIEVNGPDTNGIYQKLANYIAHAMKGQPCGPQAYCDYLFNVNCFKLRDSNTSFEDHRWNGRLNGESNFGRYTMRLCDFMVDYLGEWDLIVCNGNSLDTMFRLDKDNTMSVTGREQQLVFRWRPGGRAVFMAASTQSAPLGRPPMLPPPYWKDSSKQGIIAHETVPVTADEKQWIQEVLDKTYKKKSTRDRQGGPLADKFVVVSALRSEHPALWDKFANRRKEVHQLTKGRSSADGRTTPKTMTACPSLAQRCSHPKVGNPTNEAYLLHGSNPTSAISILDTSFKVDFAGASAGTMFGPGVYLAESSSKADEYARDENTGGAYDGLFAVLLCRVILGRSFVTETPGDYHEKCTSTEYDSVVGDREKAVGTFREFILFHEGSIYPEYVAFYRREDADGKAISSPSLPAPTTSSGAVATSAPIQVSMATPVAQTFQVQIPPGSQPGALLQVTAPSGQLMQITVPDGVSGGQTITCQCPPAI